MHTSWWMTRTRACMTIAWPGACAACRPTRSRRPRVRLSRTGDRASCWTPRGRHAGACNCYTWHLCPTLSRLRPAAGMSSRVSRAVHSAAAGAGAAAAACWLMAASNAATRRSNVSLASLACMATRRAQRARRWATGTAASTQVSLQGGGGRQTLPRALAASCTMHGPPCTTRASAPGLTGTRCC